MTSPARRPAQDSRSFDVIVVGLGAVGAATLLQLARSGARVLGIDRHHPPHDQGSSHGQTRITRLAVGEGEVFVPLVRRSHALWRELEDLSGATLFEACGFLTLDTTGGESNLHGLGGFYERTVDLARRFSIAHETFDGDEVRRRYPAFQAPSFARAYFEPDGGQLFPERCIAVQLDLAARAGAAIRTGQRVLDIRQGPHAVSVTAGDESWEAARVIVAAGAWTPSLLPGLDELRVLRQVLHWFAPERPELYRPGALPTFLWLHGARACDCFYGFPAQHDGEVKLATEQDQIATPDPDHIERRVDPTEGAALVAEHLQGRLEGLPGAPVRSKVCIYTSTADARFVVAPVPGMERVIAASACSGHGFKHSAALGEHIAALAQDAAAPIPEFAFPRPAA